MAGQTISIQSATIWPISSTPDIYQGTLASITMGMGTGHLDQCLSQRPHHSGDNQGAVQVRHSMGTTETPGTGLSSQEEQISCDADTAAGPSGIHDRHMNHDTGGDRLQDS